MIVVNGTEMLPGDLVVGWGGEGRGGIGITRCLIITISSLHDGSDCWYTVFTNDGMFCDVLYLESGQYNVLRVDA